MYGTDLPFLLLFLPFPPPPFSLPLSSFHLSLSLSPPTDPPLPTIVVPPSHTQAFIGESVLMECQGDGASESYHWLKSGQVLVYSDRVQSLDGIGLVITNVTPGDSGLYTCVVRGVAGERAVAAMLNVTGPLLSCQGVHILHC